MSAKAEDGFPLRAPRGHGVQPQPRGTAGIFGRIGAAGAGGAEGAPQGRHCAVRADGAEFGAVPFGDREERVRPSRGGRAGVGRERPQSPAEPRGGLRGTAGGRFPVPFPEGLAAPAGSPSAPNPARPADTTRGSGQEGTEGVTAAPRAAPAHILERKSSLDPAGFSSDELRGMGGWGPGGSELLEGPHQEGPRFCAPLPSVRSGAQPGGGGGFRPNPPSAVSGAGDVGMRGGGSQGDPALRAAAAVLPGCVRVRGRNHRRGWSGAAADRGGDAGSGRAGGPCGPAGGAERAAASRGLLGQSGGREQLEGSHCASPQCPREGQPWGRGTPRTERRSAELCPHPQHPVRRAWATAADPTAAHGSRPRGSSLGSGLLGRTDPAAPLCLSKAKGQRTARPAQRGAFMSAEEPRAVCTAARRCRGQLKPRPRSTGAVAPRAARGPPRGLTWGG